MKNIDIKSIIIGALLTSTIFLGVAATSPTDKWDEKQRWEVGKVAWQKIPNGDTKWVLQEDSKPNKQSGSNQVERLKNIQIDLRGKRVEEALEDIEKFLDGAILSGLGLVNILHGKGTGALMEAIHKYLKNQSFIKDYKFADEEQGGAGITVVKFK